MEKKLHRRTRPAYLMVCLVLFAATVALAVSTFSMYRKLKAADLAAGSDESQLSQESQDYGALENRCESISDEKTQLESDNARLESEKASLQAALDALNASAGDVSAEVKALETQIDGLNSDIAARDAEIESLKKQIAALNETKAPDTAASPDTVSPQETSAPAETAAPGETEAQPTASGAQAEIISKLNETLKNPGASHTIAVYYEDIEHGYSYSFCADDVYYTASLIKAPFVLSILEAATDELEAVKVDPTLKKVYDFDKQFTYSKAYYQEGSGKIKDSPSGTVYTYRQLIEYLLKYSDNVAYNVLKNEYGITVFRALVYKLGCTAMTKSLSKICAADGGKIMKAVYEYIKSGVAYSQFMYDCMTESAHRVMICAGVYPTPCAHKYGWDTGTYHDMAVVYDEHPYVLTVLTNMEEGGDKVNAYIQSVVKLVAQLHASYYPSGTESSASGGEAVPGND